MDQFITLYKSKHLTDELLIADPPGIAYQKDMSNSIEYDDKYFANYVNLEGKNIAIKLNNSRVKMVENYNCSTILDIGIGSGEFMKTFQKQGRKAYGYDINPVAKKKLIQENSFLDPYDSQLNKSISGITLWDTLEHMKAPSELLKRIRTGMYVFISLPIFETLIDVKSSKHYKPNEHYYYYTSNGLIVFLESLGYKFLESNDAETKAGREGIKSFAFLREKECF